MLGQAGGQGGAQLLGAGDRISDHIGDQTSVAIVLAHNDRRLPHTVAGVQRGLDFAQFDAEPAQFDLLVVAAQILQRAIGAPARQIAAAVHARTRLIGERIGDETFGGQSWAMQIAARQTRTGHVQFTGHTDRQALTIRSQYIRAQIRQRCTDRAVARTLYILRGECMGGDVYGGFGDAVHVEQGGALTMRGEPRGHTGRLQGFAAEDHQAQVVLQVAVLLRIDQRLERTGSLVEHADALLAQQGMEGVGIACGVL